MSRISSLSGAIAALLILVWPAAASAAPLAAYGRLPMVEDAQISPDGTMMAYAVTKGDARLVMIRAVADGKSVAFLNAGDQKVRDIQWAGAGHLLITISTTQYVAGVSGPRREYFQVLAYDLKTGKTRLLMEKAPDSMNVVIGRPHVRMLDGEPHVIVEGVHWPSGERGRSSLFSIRLSTGATRVYQQGRQNSADWVIARDGAVLAQTEYDSVTGDWSLRLRRGDRWEVVDSRTTPLNPPSLEGLNKDGAAVLLVVRDPMSNRRVVKEYPIDGSPARDIVLPPYDGLVRDPVTHALIGTWELDGDTVSYSFFDPKDQAVWRGVTKAYAGREVRLVSWTDDRRKLVVRVEEPDTGPVFALVDLDAKRADTIGVIYNDLKAEDIAEVRPIKYKAADGLEITGYLTLPRGRAPEKLPLIVLPHGGPASRDEPGFYWKAQALASRGYAVLQPNFRGSDGFGRRFLEAGYGEWGRKMQTDLSDGVRQLAGQGIVDPKRVCIVGSSYGGYAALAGATLDRGVYRCAVAVAGLSDLKRFMASEARETRGSNNDTLRYWSRFMGVEGRGDRDLLTISPITYAAQVEIPVLLIHGKDDTVVLFEQSRMMFDALRRAGKTTELVTLKGEDHWLSRADTRLQMLEATVAFLEKYNPPN
ncbi:MAG TPA: S9 family peptidase [Caulobacter sp.]|nr:S9 family peptidase [Caulobacter sp.]